MLVISRQRDESIMIGDDIEVTVVDIRDDKVRLGINPPREISVHRKEVYEAIRRANRAAAQVDPPSIGQDLIQARAERLAAAGIPKSPNADVSIRLATDLDLRYINEIYNHYVANSTNTYQEQPDSLEARQQWLAHHGVKHPVTVAVLDHRVVGWGSLSPFHSRSAFRKTVESSVYVHHDFHRRGIGSALLQDLINRARDAGHHTIIAAIDSLQAPSLSLHEQFGFVRVAHMKEVGFKFGKWLDVIDLQLML